MQSGARRVHDLKPQFSANALPGCHRNSGGQEDRQKKTVPHPGVGLYHDLEGDGSCQCRLTCNAFEKRSDMICWFCLLPQWQSTTKRCDSCCVFIATKISGLPQAVFSNLESNRPTQRCVKHGKRRDC